MRTLELTSAALKAQLDYDAGSGQLLWKSGRPAGRQISTGVIVVTLNGTDYRGHILAWLYVHGKRPDRKLRHIDQNPANNAIANLEEIPRYRKAYESLTWARLQSLLNYEPDTGRFTWAVNRPRIREGEEAGCISDEGYRCIEVEGKTYKAHRLAWFYAHAVWPSNKIDHKNEIKTDNRLDNLRDVSDQVSAQNRTAGWGKSKHLGVHADPAGGWRAAIRLDGKATWLGTFSTEDEAAAAYRRAKAEMHPGWIAKPSNLEDICAR